MDQKKSKPKTKMTPGRRQRFERKRQQIFSGALACFETKGYFESTMIDIANASGVSAGLIYKYFSDKRDLLFQVILEIIEAHNRTIPQALIGKSEALERFHAATHAYFQVINDRTSATVFAYRESASLERSQIGVLKNKEMQASLLLTECVQACVNKELFAPDNVDLVTMDLVLGAHAWALKNWRLRKIVSFEEYFLHEINMVLRAILTERGRQTIAKLGYEWARLGPGQ